MSQTGIPFGYHIYDLGRGVAQRFGPSLIGHPMPHGVLHAAVVIFGYEYFFEGGISKRPAGCTRFGKNFSFVPAPGPATAVKCEEDVDVWIRYLEMGQWGALAYSLVENNCVHFVDLATQFFTEGKCRAPDLIANNIQPVMASPLGRLLCDVAKVMSGSGMLDVAEEMHSRRLCRVAGFHVRKIFQQHGTDHSDKKETIPPQKIFCFSVDLSRSSQLSLKTRLVARVQQLIADAFKERPEPNDRQISAERLEQLLLSGVAAAPMDQRSEACTLHVAVTHAFLTQKWCNSFDDMSLNLTLLVQLTLHEAFVQSAICDVAFRSVITRLTRHFFPVLPTPLKVAVLEALCNLLKHPVAAAQMTRSMRMWVPHIAFVVCRGLLEPDSWEVVHRASCLLVNFLYATTTFTRNAFDIEVLRQGGAHPAMRMVSVGLFVASRVVPNDPEQCFAVASLPVNAALCASPQGAARWNLQLEHATAELRRMADEEKKKKLLQGLDQAAKRANNNNDNDDDEDEDEDDVFAAGDAAVDDLTKSIENAEKIFQQLVQVDIDEVYAEDSGSGSFRGASSGSSFPPSPSFSATASAVSTIQPEQVPKNLAENLKTVTQAVLNNAMQAVVLFVVSGKQCQQQVRNSKLTPPAEVLKKASVSAENKKLAHDIGLVV